MKSIVMYSSKNGYALECAQQIVEGIRKEGDEAELAEIGKETKKINLADYETVIIGGGIHAGHLSGSLRRYCMKHEGELRSKRLGLFVCGTDKEHQEKQFTDNFPQSLLDVAVTKGWFGGRIIFAQQKGVMRFVLKKLLKGEHDVHDERPEAVTSFVSDIG